MIKLEELNPITHQKEFDGLSESEKLDKLSAIHRKAIHSSRHCIAFAFRADIGEAFNYWCAPVYHDVQKYPMLLITGPTGSGKTLATMHYIACFFAQVPTDTLTILDYKNDDFRFCDGCPDYFGYKRVKDGLATFYQAFQARLNGTDSSRRRKLLVIEEWAAYLCSLEKKEAGSEKAKLAEMLMLGRSLGISIVVTMQRADAEFFPKGSRDNFQAILALGNLSREAKEMLFPDHKELLEPICEVGMGYFRQADRCHKIWVFSSSINSKERILSRLQEQTNK